MLPICALAAIFFPGATSGRNVLHDQLVPIIGDRADMFGDLRSFVRPFYHMAKLAPWSIGTYVAKPLSAYPPAEQEDAHGLLREHGCESLPGAMFCRDHQTFLAAKVNEFHEENFQRWAQAESVLNQVVAHLAARVRVKCGIGTDPDPDQTDPEVEGLWSVPIKRLPRRSHLKLIHGGQR